MSELNRLMRNVGELMEAQREAMKELAEAQRERCERLAARKILTEGVSTWTSGCRSESSTSNQSTNLWPYQRQILNLIASGKPIRPLLSRKPNHVLMRPLESQIESEKTNQSQSDELVIAGKGAEEAAEIRREAKQRVRALESLHPQEREDLHRPPTPDTPEVITAYRAFRITRHGNLTSLTVGTSNHFEAFPADGHYEAQCFHSGCPSRKNLATAPVFRCQCGFWAFKERSVLEAMIHYVEVHAEVELFGKVVEHEVGYRAQYMRIKKLWPGAHITYDPSVTLNLKPLETEPLVRDAAKKYGVEFDESRRQHDEADVSWLRSWLRRWG